MSELTLQEPFHAELGTFRVAWVQETSRSKSPRPATRKPAVVTSPPPPVADVDAATSAVNRSYEHLHYPSYVAYCAGFCGLRTMVFHPMTLALARKQALNDYAHLSSSEVLRRLVRMEGGPGALSTGLFVMVAANTLSEVINSGLFECLRSELPLKSEVSRDAAAGYSADFACRFVYTPLLLVANRQMTQTAPIVNAPRGSRVVHPLTSNSTAQIIRGVYAAEGGRGFFRGLGATITVGCSWSAAWWAIYAQTKRALYEVAPRVLPSADGRLGKMLPASVTSHDDNVVVNGAASVLTSASTAVIFNPFLVVRTRVQIEANATFRSVGRKVLKESGVRGFFNGTMLSVSACALDGLIASSCYEWAKYLADTTVRR